MLGFATDENVENAIIRGLRRRHPDVDVLRPMPGVVLLRPSLSVGQAIEDLALLARCSVVGEWDGQVIYLPL